MSNTERVDKSLFEEEHYLGKPADANDLLVRRRIALLEDFLPFWEGDNLLEIGCGNGNTVLPLSKKFTRSIGLEYADVHKREYEQLRNQLGVTNSKFETWDILSGPYSFNSSAVDSQLGAEKNALDELGEEKVPMAELEDNKGLTDTLGEIKAPTEETISAGKLADRLISFEVIEHLPSEDGVRNYAESLKMGGIAAISVPNKWWIFETHGANLPLLPWNRVPFFSWLPRPLHERWSHARIYTRKRIVKLLEKHGFEILKVQYVTAPMDVVKWKPLQSFLRNWVFRGNSTTNPFKAVSILVFCKRIR
jgi:SAM-dependent methyltransferase